MNTDQLLFVDITNPDRPLITGISNVAAAAGPTVYSGSPRRWCICFLTPPTTRGAAGTVETTSRVITLSAKRTRADGTALFSCEDFTAEGTGFSTRYVGVLDTSVPSGTFDEVEQFGIIFELELKDPGTTPIERLVYQFGGTLIRKVVGDATGTNTSSWITQADADARHVSFVAVQSLSTGAKAQATANLFGNNFSWDATAGSLTLGGSLTLAGSITTVTGGISAQEHGIYGSNILFNSTGFVFNRTLLTDKTLSIGSSAEWIGDGWTMSSDSQSFQLIVYTDETTSTMPFSYEAGNGLVLSNAGTTYFSALNNGNVNASGNMVAGGNLTAAGSITAASGTISGNLTLSTSPTSSTHAVNKAYADALVVGLIDDRGNYSASGNTFPTTGGSGTAGAILKGDLWVISVAGTLGGNAVAVGDQIRALVDSPGQTAANWAISEANIAYVPQAQHANLTAISAGAWAGASSIVTVGTLTTGTWQGTAITGTYGGTGVNNGSYTLTLGGNVSFGAMGRTLAAATDAAAGRAAIDASRTIQTAYSAATAYAVGEIVMYYGLPWLCILAATGKEPLTNPTYWQPLGSLIDGGRWFHKTTANAAPSDTNVNYSVYALGDSRNYYSSTNGGTAKARWAVTGLTNYPTSWPDLGTYGYVHLPFDRPGYIDFLISNYSVGARTVHLFLGKFAADAVGDLTRAGVQLKITLASGVRTYKLGVHNGTSLAESSNLAGFTDDDKAKKVRLAWDGAGNFVCFINGVLATNGTLTSTGLNAALTNNANGYLMGVDATNSSVTQSHFSILTKIDLVTAYGSA